MQREIAIIQSKTFWSLVLALVAFLADAFKIPWLYGWSNDPSTPDAILKFVEIAGILLAGASRVVANAKVTSVITPSGSAGDKTTYGHAWLAVALLLLGSLGGCATVGEIAGATVNPNYAYALVQTFNGFETSADGYLQLPACVTGGSAACRNASAVAIIVPAVRTGRTARNAVVAALHAANGGAIPIASYQTLTAAVQTLQSAYANYNIALPAKGN